MPLDLYEIIVLAPALVAVLMLGTTHLSLNLWLYCAHTALIAAATAYIAGSGGEGHLYMVAVGICVIKAAFIPYFLSWIIRKLQVQSDAGVFIPAPLSLHLGILLFGAAYLLAAQLPGLTTNGDSRLAATAAISLVCTGTLLMLTRKIALSQIIGFLVIENGIYLFALTQTRGMPLIVEMGIFLDVLVGVMITGLLLFRIKKSFEHIDVTQLTELRD
jgi:hydrogenase-4 component E